MLIHHLVGHLVTHFYRNENGNSQAQSQPGHSPPLGVKLTPFHLLSLVSITIFGIWRLLLSYYDQWVVITRVELVLVTIAAAMYGVISQLVAWEGLHFVGLMASQIILSHDD